jgi:hypothetical protein
MSMIMRKGFKRIVVNQVSKTFFTYESCTIILMMLTACSIQAVAIQTTKQ